MQSNRRLHVCSGNTLLARTFVVPPMAASGAPRVLPTLDTSSSRSCACKSACDGHATHDHSIKPPSMAHRLVGHDCQMQCPHTCGLE